MKKAILTSLACLSLSSPAWAELLDAWDFNGLAATTATTATPATIAPTFSIGGGLLDISAFGLGTTQGTNPERTSFAGSTLNTFPGGEAGTGAALALANMSANGKSAIFSFSLSGYQDLVLSFATRGTSTGFNLQEWFWSTDGLSYSKLPVNNTANTTSTFTVQTVDFSSVDALDNAPNAYIKLTVSGAASAAGNNRFDNIQLNATAIPEPNSLLFFAGGLGLVAWNRLRRRE